jgi:transposase InsO family protein
MISIKSDFVVKRLRSDNGGEYKNKKMSDLCEKLKISQQFTVPYNPEQNCLAERMNRT